MRLASKGLIILAFLAGIGLAAQGFYISQTTGLLDVKSDKTSAILSISQPSHRTVKIGLGSAKVHLKPGDYTVSATSGQIQKSSQIHISQKQKSELVINIGQASKVPLDQNDVMANTLIKLLPYAGPNREYWVTYSYNFSGGAAKPVITVTSSSVKGRQDALDWMKSLGFEPTKLNINYVSTAH